MNPWPYPLWIAHRGAGKLAPENTLAAFRHGASFGYRMFEFDVKLSGDSASVLLHDATLQRTITWRRAIAAAARIGVLATGVSLWWIFMLRAQGAYGAEYT